ncbi:MAG: translation elongation factor Ts, partial [Thermonemataceae bacterium]
GTESTIVAINCETESVAINDAFNQLANTVLEKAVSEKPADSEALLAIEVEGKAIQEHITQFMGKVGEKIIVSAYERVSGEAVIPYLHNNGKLGVLVALKGVNGAEVEEAGKDVAMQIAAMNPIAVDKEGVPTDLVEKEIEIGKEQARNEGKPEDLVEKIALGKLNRFYKDNTLLNQAFVKDGSKTVAKMLQEINKELTVVDFKRVAIA